MFGGKTRLVWYPIRTCFFVSRPRLDGTDGIASFIVAQKQLFSYSSSILSIWDTPMIPVFKKVRLTFRVLGITVLVPCIKASTRGTFFLFAKSKTGLALYSLHITSIVS